VFESSLHATGNLKCKLKTAANLKPLIFFNYREDSYFVDWFHGSVLHGNQCTTSCKAYMNFADESACLMADNVQNEVH
jgi:hypothetical protein